MNAIQCQGLTRSYPGFTLGPLTLSLPQGTILGLVGENGAGKSTTLRLLMNAIPRAGGSVTMLGTDNQSPQFQALKEDIGVVLDEACFPRALTPQEIGKMLARTYRRWDGDAFAGYLRRFQLPPDKPFKDLSRGMKMKLAIAAALSHGARLLLLDEPTSGLDPMVRDEILDILNDFTRDETHSVVLSSHITSDLEKICDYIGFLHRGRLILLREKDRLLEEYTLLSLPHDRLEELDPLAIGGTKPSPYGVEVLAKKDAIPPSFLGRKPSLEDIILFLAKGDRV